MHGLLKVYTVGVALIAGGAVAIAADSREELARARHTNVAWQQTTAQWQDVAARVIAHDRAVTRTHNTLVKRYQDLARAAKAAAASPKIVTKPSTAAAAPVAPAVAPVAAPAATRTS